MTRFAALLAQDSVEVEERTVLADGRPSESEQPGLSDYTLVLRRVKRLLEAGKEIEWCEARIRDVVGAVRGGSNGRSD